MPATGTIHRWRPPAGPSVGVEHSLADGLVVSLHYDAMVAKCSAAGAMRDIAGRVLFGALDGTLLSGPVSNRDFLRRILRASRLRRQRL